MVDWFLPFSKHLCPSQFSPLFKGPLLTQFMSVTAPSANYKRFRIVPSFLERFFHLCAESFSPAVCTAKRRSSLINWPLSLLCCRWMSPRGSQGEEIGKCHARRKAELCFMGRADRKSQVGQCLCFCTADFWSSLAYESTKQKHKHCLS